MVQAHSWALSYDIDIIIRRTLVYSILTVLLAGVYFGSIVLLQQLFRPLFGPDHDLAIVASTLVIAALFQPLRRRIQATIDRRFYHPRYDASRNLIAFSTNLHDEVDLMLLTQPGGHRRGRAAAGACVVALVAGRWSEGAAAEDGSELSSFQRPSSLSVSSRRCKDCLPCLLTQSHVR